MTTTGAPSALPTDIDLLIGAWTQLASSPVKAVRAARRIVETALHVSEHNRDSGVMPPPSPFSAPKTSFNQSITPHRRVAFADVRARRSEGGEEPFRLHRQRRHPGALRERATALPARSRTSFPRSRSSASCRCRCATDDERLSAGNRISAMLTSLATDIADPVERLRTISAGMSDAKSQESRIGAEVLTDWTEFTFPALIGRAAASSRRCGSSIGCGRRSMSRSRISRDLRFPCSLQERTWSGCTRSGLWSRVPGSTSP